MLSNRLLPEEDPGPAAELVERLACADTEAKFWSVASAFTSRRLGASHTLVLRRAADPLRERWTFSTVFAPAGVEPLPPFESPAELAGMGLVAAPPSLSLGGAFGPVFTALPEAAKGGLVHAEIGASHVLLVVYRWAPPVLSHRNWQLLESITQETAAALLSFRAAARDHGDSIQPLRDP